MERRAFHEGGEVYLVASKCEATDWKTPDKPFHFTGKNAKVPLHSLIVWILKKDICYLKNMSGG